LYQTAFSILSTLISGASATLKKIGDATLTNDCASECPEEICQDDDAPYTKSSLRDFFTVLALSFHAVFEGLAVGLEKESQDVWLLFAGNSNVRVSKVVTDHDDLLTQSRYHIVVSRSMPFPYIVEVFHC
jgi:hypothetical protein